MNQVFLQNNFGAKSKIKKLIQKKGVIFAVPEKNAEKRHAQPGTESNLQKNKEGSAEILHPSLGFESERF